MLPTACHKAKRIAQARLSSFEAVRLQGEKILAQREAVSEAMKPFVQKIHIASKVMAYNMI